MNLEQSFLSNIDHQYKEGNEEVSFLTTFHKDGNVKFNFWAPDSKNVSLCIENLEILMEPKKNGWFQLISKQAKSGSKYQFRLDNGMLVPDPASRYQSKDVHGPSVLINPENFDWEDDYHWKGRPWNQAMIYEVHTGTFSKEGTFKAIKEKLDYLKDLGVTAIELMPVSDFPGKRNWGYDGVLHFAPDNTYGTPDDLKDLIKAVHRKGIMVILDVVYNHFGPEGNYLYVYAKSKFFNPDEKTPWGDAINFEDQNVRNFFIQNALYWLEEYHFDGLRIDAVHAIKDNSKIHILDEMAQILKQRIKDRHIHLILENDNNEVKYLKPRNKSEEGNFIAQWNDDFHHAMHILLTGEKFGYYSDYSNEKSPHKPVYYLARSLAEGFAYQGEKSAYRNGISRGENSKNFSPTSFINFIQNHDQVGNRAFAQRINKLTSPEAFKAAACIYLLSPSIPLIFMGEEFASEQPFTFFCDFEECLAKSVKEGRLKEFSQNPEFSDKKLIAKLPDATSEKSFMESKINWNHIKKQKNKEVLDFYKKMLKTRREFIIPFIGELKPGESEFKIIKDNLFSVIWQGRNGTDLELIANLSNDDLDYKRDFPGKLIAESNKESFKKLNDKKIFSKWGVFWFLNKTGCKYHG